MTIGEKIKFYRKQKSLSQKKLGELARISETSIKKYESGDRNPKLEQIFKLATILEVGIEDFVDMPEQLVNSDDVVSKIEEAGRILGSDMKYTVTREGIDEETGLHIINLEFQLTKESADEMLAVAFEGATDHASFKEALVKLLNLEFSNSPLEERQRMYDEMSKTIDEKFKK